MKATKRDDLEYVPDSGSQLKLTVAELYAPTTSLL